jgi:hypothetical protein
MMQPVSDVTCPEYFPLQLHYDWDCALRLKYCYKSHRGDLGTVLPHNSSFKRFVAFCPWIIGRRSENGGEEKKNIKIPAATHADVIYPIAVSCGPPGLKPDNNRKIPLVLFFVFCSKWLLFFPSFLFVRLIFMSFYRLVSVKRQLNGNLFHFGQFAGPDRCLTDRTIVNARNIPQQFNALFKFYPICSDWGVEHEEFIGRPNGILKWIWLFFKKWKNYEINFEKCIWSEKWISWLEGTSDTGAKYFACWSTGKGGKQMNHRLRLIYVVNYRWRRR